ATATSVATIAYTITRATRSTVPISFFRRTGMDSGSRSPALDRAKALGAQPVRRGATGCRAARACQSPRLGPPIAPFADPVPASAGAVMAVLTETSAPLAARD